MSPEAVEAASGSTQDPAQINPEEGTSGKPDRSSKTQESQGSSTLPGSANGVNDLSNKSADAKNEKISGAELKRRKQEEKAKKRAQAKEQQPVHSGESSRGSRPDGSSRDHARNNATTQPPPSPAAKGQHKRTGSISTNAQNPLQLRPPLHQAQAPTSESKKETKKVAFCSHLYGSPRRTTIAGAGKDVHPSVLALGLQMSNYIICGSNARCVSTLLVFKRVINAYTTPPGTSLPRHLTIHLSTQIDYLVSCRPLSISMGNAIRWLKLAISTIDPDTSESKAKSELCSAIDNFIRERITVAGRAIASSACSKIQDGDAILTFAKSSIVERTLAEAYRQGKKFRVIVVDSRPLFEAETSQSRWRI